MEIIHWFLSNYPNLVNDMKNTSHHLNDNFAIYHAEGDVFTHTMIVYNHIMKESFYQMNKVKDPNMLQKLKRETTELKLAALLHDIGKVSTKCVKENRGYASFTFHENVSMFESISILEKFEKDFPKEKIDKIKILKAINWHQNLHKIGKFEDGEIILPEEQRQWLNHFYGQDLDFYSFMVKLGTADAFGRIAEDMDRLYKKYEFLDQFIPEEMYHVKDNKPIAYVLTGPQCSGKSVYAKELMSQGKEFVYLSTDDILTQGGKIDYNMVYTDKAASKANMQIFDELKKAVIERKNIIVDQTNTDPAGRSRKLACIPDKYYHKVVVNVFSAPERLKERNKDRKKEGKSMDFSIIERKMKEFELAGTDICHEAQYILT